MKCWTYQCCDAIGLDDDSRKMSRSDKKAQYCLLALLNLPHVNPKFSVQIILHLSTGHCQRVYKEVQRAKSYF